MAMEERGSGTDAPPGFAAEMEERGVETDAPPGFAAEMEERGVETDAPPGFSPAAAESPPLETSQALSLLEELNMKLSEDSLALMPAFLAVLKHDSKAVVRQSILTGIRLCHAVFQQMAVQLDKCGNAERWLVEMWGWMVKLKNAMYDILTLEPGPVGIKMLAVKFLEAYLLLFTSDASNTKSPYTEGTGSKFNLLWIAEGNSLLYPSVLASEENATLAFLFDILQSASSLCLHGSLTIVVINCLTAVARSCPVHYNRILSMLLDCYSDLEILERGHAASIRFSLRTALLRFLKCTHQVIIESRDELLKALRAMNSGEATEQIIRQLEKVPKVGGHCPKDVRLIKGAAPCVQDVISKKPVVSDKDCFALADGMLDKRTGIAMNGTSFSPAEADGDFVQENILSGFSLSSLKVGGKATEVEKMMLMVGSLMAEGERAIESLDILISNINADLMADIVIDNMKHLPKNPSKLLGSHGDLKMDLHGSTPRLQQYAFANGSMAVQGPNNPVGIMRDGGGSDSAMVSSPPIW